MEILTNPCALAFWKGGFLVGGAIVLIVFVALSVGVLLARDRKQEEQRPEL